MNNKKAILLSGGIDSACIAMWLKPEVAITIDYGQRSALGEIRAAAKIASLLGLQHEIVTIDCSSLGAGDLAGTSPASGSPSTEWWPFRNQLIVTLAVSKAYTIGVNHLLVGSIKSDSFHVDGTHSFYSSLDNLVSIQEGGIRVEAPALDLSSEELIRVSRISSEMLAWTHSCHKANYACGSCRGCNKNLSTIRSIEQNNHITR